MFQLVNSHFQANVRHFVYKYEILATEYDVLRTKLYLICNSINLNKMCQITTVAYVTVVFAHCHTTMNYIR